MVLGAYWLRTLGPILWDFSNLWMKFTLNTKECRLKGGLPKGLEALQPSKVRKTRKDNGALLQLCSIQKALLSTVPDPQIERPLQEYEVVFKEPKEPPSQRTQDHQIPLLEGTSPV